MARFVKWSYNLRKLLYDELLKRFGPYNTWGKGTPTGKEKEFDLFCEDFSNIVSFISQSKTTKDAVKLQIAWATTCQESIPNSYAHSFIQNIGIALESGFVESKDLPTQILMERQNPHKK
jgi:hypothetical protein